jgi:hypothetical protein
VTSEEIAADVATTIALWQREGLTPWAAWLAMGRLGEASSWAIVAGWMIWHMQQQQQRARLRAA